MGRIAGPDTPPTLFDNADRPVPTSIHIPGPTVLMAVSTSAPFCWQVPAIRASEAHCADSLMDTGTAPAFSFTARVTRPQASGSAANGTPNSDSTFGHDTFTSIRSGLAAATRRVSRPNSSALPAKIETNSGVSHVRRYSASSSSSASTPGFDSPTALIRPPGHGNTHGAGWPARAARLHDLVVTAPAPACATRRSEAAVVPSTPDASTSGDSSATPAIWTASGFMP